MIVMNDDQELETTLINWFNFLVETFYAEGLKKKMQRYERCLQMNDEYVEMIEHPLLFEYASYMERRKKITIDSIAFYLSRNTITY